jgi:hypothetical protein
MVLIFGEVMKCNFAKRDKEALACDYMFGWYELSEAAALCIEDGELDRRRFFDFLRVYCPVFPSAATATSGRVYLQCRVGCCSTISTVFWRLNANGPPCGISITYMD